MPNIDLIDLLAIAILGVAAVRGLYNGMIREVFSILALAAAVVAVRVWNEPFADWLYTLAKGQVSSTVVPWISGAAIGVGVALAVGAFGSVMRGSAKAVGLGWADRAGGAALGVVEGALAVGIALLVAGGVLGRENAMLAGSRSLALLEQVEEVAESAQIPLPAPADVAAAAPE